MARKNGKKSKFKKESYKKDETDKTVNPSEGEPNSDKDVKPATNDPEWYARDPQLLLDAGSIPFSDPMGKPVTLNIEHRDGVTNAGTDLWVQFADGKTPSVPGICVINTAPSYGHSEDRLSPLNVAATALYTHVRYVNSGRKNYDACDLMLYCATVAELYSYIMWMQRIYNAAFIFSQRNQYIGRELLQAMGVNAENIIQDLPAFRYWINVYINKISSYAVPASLYLFKRRAFMYSQIYTESISGNIKDQLYMFNPACFYQFKLDDQGKGMLKLIDSGAVPSTSGLTINNLEELGEKLLANVFGDEDFGLMSGDILKAFGSDILTLAPLGEEGGIIPIYDAFVLHQMRNTRVIGDYRNGKYGIRLSDSVVQAVQSGDVVQDAKGNLHSRVFYSFTGDVWDSGNIDLQERLANWGADPVISIDAPVSDPAMVVEVTRLLTIGKPNLIAYEDFDDIHPGMVAEYDTGSDVAMSFTICQFNNAGEMVYTTYNNSCLDAIFREGHPEVVDPLMQFVTSFHYMPIMYLSSGLRSLDETNLLTVGVDRIISDLENYTVQSKAVIRRLHDLSMLSLLYVPGVAKQINYMK